MGFISYYNKCLEILFSVRLQTFIREINCQTFLSNISVEMVVNAI